MHERTNDTTRRGVLAATAGLAAASLGGCISQDDATAAISACRKRDDDELGDLPTSASAYAHGMSLSGTTFSAGDGSAAHTFQIARGHEGDWTLDTVDMLNYGGPDSAEGVPVYESHHTYLEEGGTAVFLAAENDRGVVVSPDAEDNRELNRLLPD